MLYHFSPMFLIMAFSFDLYRWLIFIISAQYPINDPIILQKRNRYLKTGLIICLALPFVVFTGFLIVMLMNITDEDAVMALVDPRGIFIGVMYSVFIIIYVIVFIKLNVVLKNNFSNYYNLHKKRLYILSYLIVSSIAWRIVFAFYFRKD